MRRTVLALSALALIGGVVAPAFASQELPVGVTYSTKGGVFVGTTVFDQPAAGASVYNGRACAGFSEQLPFCVAGPVIK